MVEIELLARQRLRAILAGVPVALEDVVARELELLAGQLVEKRQQDHARQPDRAAGRAHRFQIGDRRVAHGEIDPVQQREGEEIIFLMMHDLRVAPGQQAEGAAGTDHVHRLP